MLTLLVIVAAASAFVPACDQPHELCMRDLPGGLTRQIVATDRRVYVTDTLNLHVLESFPDRCARYAASYTLDRAGNGAIAADGDLVFLSAADGIHVVDTSEADAPRRLAIYPSPRLCASGCNLALADRRLYYHGPEDSSVNGPTWLHVVDVSNPAAPTLIRAVATQAVSGASVVRGDTLFVSGQGDLHLVDVTDRDFPAWLSKVAVPLQGLVAKVEAWGDRVFIPQGTLEEVDVSDRQLPRHVGTFDNRVGDPTNALQVVVRGDRAWIVAGDWGIVTLDISQIGQPHIIGRWRPEPIQFLGAIAGLEGVLHAAGSSPGSGPQRYVSIHSANSGP